MANSREEGGTFSTRATEPDSRSAILCCCRRDDSFNYRESMHLPFRPDSLNADSVPSSRQEDKKELQAWKVSPSSLIPSVVLILPFLDSSTRAHAGTRASREAIRAVSRVRLQGVLPMW